MIGITDIMSFWCLNKDLNTNLCHHYSTSIVGVPLIRFSPNIVKHCILVNIVTLFFIGF